MPKISYHKCQSLYSNQKQESVHRSDCANVWSNFMEFLGPKLKTVKTVKHFRNRLKIFLLEQKYLLVSFCCVQVFFFSLIHLSVLLWVCLIHVIVVCTFFLKLGCDHLWPLDHIPHCICIVCYHCSCM